MANLTEQQQRFVTAFTSEGGAIGNASEAARRAGYSEKSARVIGQQLLAKPHVAAAIMTANRERISGELATKAVHLLERVVDDEAVPVRTRVEAAKTILDRAGMTAAQAEPPTNREKDLSQMTEEELVDFIRKGKEELERGRGDYSPDGEAAARIN